jgi:Secretion system C-terminal sorting domain
MKNYFNPVNYSLLRLCVIVIIFNLVTNKVVGQSCPTSYTPDYLTKNGAGDWYTTADWTTSAPPAAWTVGSTVTIPTNTILEVNSANFTLANHNLVVNGTLIVSGKLTLSLGYSITISAGAILCCGSACNPSEKLYIGTTPVWDGNDGAVPGPASSSGGPLPVELLFFHALATEQSISLKWATATERDADYFAIEKSVNGKDFTEIGREKAAGNSIFRKDYSFADNLPLLGRSYYRLKQVDFNGNFEYFNITFVDVAGKKAISVHPNPIQDNTLQLHLNFTTEDQIFSKIYNSTGALVKSFSFSGTSFKSESNLKPGTYLLKVEAGKEHFTQRFVIP